MGALYRFQGTRQGMHRVQRVLLGTLQIQLAPWPQAWIALRNKVEVMTLEDCSAGLDAIRAVCKIESHQVTFNKLAPGANLDLTVAAMNNKWNNRMVIPFYRRTLNCKFSTGCVFKAIPSLAGPE